MRDAVFAVLCTAVLTPLLVLSSAAAGLGPRHWSGVPLSGFAFSLLDSRPTDSGARPELLDEVTDMLIATDHQAWTAVYSGGQGLILVETTRLSRSMFAELGDRFGGDAVGVVYSPLTPPTYPGGPGDGPAVESAWERMDPIGTWFTLLTGFPWQLGTVVLLTTIVWVLVGRRRRHRQTPTPEQARAGGSR